MVEVSPIVDGAGEETVSSGAKVVSGMLSSIVKRGLRVMGKVAEVKQTYKKDEL